MFVVRKSYLYFVVFCTSSCKLFFNQFGRDVPWFTQHTMFPVGCTVSIKEVWHGFWPRFLQFGDVQVKKEITWLTGPKEYVTSCIWNYGKQSKIRCFKGTNLESQSRKEYKIVIFASFG